MIELRFLDYCDYDIDKRCVILQKDIDAWCMSNHASYKLMRTDSAWWLVLIHFENLSDEIRFKLAWM